MRFWLSLAVFALVVLIAGAAAAQSPVWYWCDAFRGYYPWVRSCPSGWRPVNPASVFPQAYGAAAPAIAQPAPPQAPTAAPNAPSVTSPKFPALGDSLDPWCAQVKLPSSIAICSDAELRALAVERQHASDEAKFRLNPDQQKALLADQNGWVKTYPQACGVHPNAAPSLPLAGNIKSCMAQAGRARIAYLRAYGGTAGAAPPPAHAPPVPSNTDVAAHTLVGKWCEQRDGKLMEPVDIAVAATGGRVYAEGFVPEMHMTVERVGVDVTMISASGGVRYELRDNATLETTVSGVRRVYVRCNPHKTTTTASATAPTTTEKTPPIVAETPPPSPPATGSQPPADSLRQNLKARWYVTNLGAETCVPLDDVGPNMQRLYYGSGSMRTPDDLVQYFESTGIHLTVDLTHTDEYSRVYIVSGSNTTKTGWGLVLYNNLAMCEFVMSNIPK